MKTVYNKITHKVIGVWDAVETEELGVTDKMCVEAFIEPCFDGDEFYEGATVEFIDTEKTAKFMSLLQDTASNLRDRAKAAAIDKKGDRNYIFSQVELYELKNKVASGEIVNPYMTELLQNEAVEYGLPYEYFQELIMTKYDLAKSAYEVFLLMIERCRTKIQTLIENKSWTAVEQGFALVDTLSDASQAQEIMTQILAL